jgi:hypothetical protein
LTKGSSTRVFLLRKPDVSHEKGKEACRLATVMFGMIAYKSKEDLLM